MQAPKRKLIDCSLLPNEQDCTLSISGTENEVIEAAVRHAVVVHGLDNTPELRLQIQALLKDE